VSTPTTDRSSDAAQPKTTPSIRGALVATYAFAVVMASTTLPTPLYAIYAAHLHLKPFMITVIFATYAVGVLAALLLFGRLSDQIGRRPVLFAAMTCSALSSVIFISSARLPTLFAGRLVSGISAGLVTGAAAAYISELHHDRARGSSLATLATMGGLGLGPLVSGLLAEHAAAPTKLPYLAGIVLLIPALLLLGIGETVPRRPGAVRALVKPQRLGVPAEMRVPFAAAAIAGFVGFSLLGFITSLAGDVLSIGLGDHSHQTVGIVAFVSFSAATLAQLATGRLSTRRASLTGLAVLPIGVVLMTIALPQKSLSLLVLGVIIGGAGAGFALRAAVLSINQQAPPERRGEVLSTFFVIAYIGISLPVIGAGILITTTTLLTATVTLAVFVSVLATGAAAILVRLPTSPTSPAAS
jgi:MFS family permease